MQIKTYTAVSMKDALAQIKSELGSNAVIVSTREIRESGYGLMSKPLIEVVAAVDYDEGACTSCLLYTSDAADDLPCVDLGGRHNIKKTNTKTPLNTPSYST